MIDEQWSVLICAKVLKSIVILSKIKNVNSVWIAVIEEQQIHRWTAAVAAATAVVVYSGDV